MNEEKQIEVINFLQDFGCASLEQLQILFNEKDNNLKSILNKNFASKKDNTFIYNGKNINNKILAAIDVLCKYKGRYKQFHKNFEPVYITFLTKRNELYNIIVTDKDNEKGVLKLLKINSPLIPEADKFILLFENEDCYDEVQCNVPFLYCTYPELKIMNNHNH